LDKLQADKLIEYDKLRDGLELNVAMLETVRRVGSDVISKGVNSDIVRLSDDLHTQAMELFKTPPQTVVSISVRFKVSEKLQALRRLTANNLIGDIQQVDKAISQ